MTAATSLVTADDLLIRRDDGFRYELWRGELKKLAPASHEHGRIAINISTPLDQHTRTNELGRVYAAETGFKISSDPDTVLAPDVAFISNERLEQAVGATGYWPGAPDLVVEVISPSDTYAEVEEKASNWLAAAVRVVIVANPRERTVTAYRSSTDIVILTEADKLDCSDVVAGWSMLVKDVFE